MNIRDFYRFSISEICYLFFSVSIRVSRVKYIVRTSIFYGFFFGKKFLRDIYNHWETFVTILLNMNYESLRVQSCIYYM